MKLIRLKTKDGRVVIGINHEGRVERLFESVDDIDPTIAKDLAERVVNAHNACESINDGSLAIMADGGGDAGTLPERIVAWSLFVGRARASARRIIDEARAILAKEGGKL